MINRGAGFHLEILWIVRKISSPDILPLSRLPRFQKKKLTLQSITRKRRQRPINVSNNLYSTH